MVDQHYWQAGRKGSSRRAIRAMMLAADLKVEREYTIPGFPYRRFYVLR